VTDHSRPPDAFARIVEENYQRVYNVIYRLIEDQQEAEDLTQDTFVNAHRRWMPRCNWITKTSCGLRLKTGRNARTK